jgi:hypothetical protein
MSIASRAGHAVLRPGQLRWLTAAQSWFQSARFQAAPAAHASTAGLRLIVWRRGDAAPAVTGYGVK